MPGRNVHWYYLAGVPAILYPLDSARHGCATIYHRKACWGVGPDGPPHGITREVWIVPSGAGVESVNGHGYSDSDM